MYPLPPLPWACIVNRPLCASNESLAKPPSSTPQRRPLPARSFRVLSKAGLLNNAARLCAAARLNDTSDDEYEEFRFVGRSYPLYLANCDTITNAATDDALQGTFLQRPIDTDGSVYGGPAITRGVSPRGFVTIGFPATGTNCSYSAPALYARQSVGFRVNGEVVPGDVKTWDCTYSLEQVFVIEPCECLDTGPGGGGTVGVPEVVCLHVGHRASGLLLCCWLLQHAYGT